MTAVSRLQQIAEANAIEAALTAVSQLQQISEEVPEAEEEVLIHEWDEERDEECEDLEW